MTHDWHDSMAIIAGYLFVQLGHCGSGLWSLQTANAKVTAVLLWLLANTEKKVGQETQTPALREPEVPAL